MKNRKNKCNYTSDEYSSDSDISICSSRKYKKTCKKDSDSSSDSSECPRRKHSSRKSDCSSSCDSDYSHKKHTSKKSDRHSSRKSLRCIKKYYKTINNTTGTVYNNNVTAYSDFFGLMPGDNSATVGAGTAVSFPQDGPSNGLITRLDDKTFSLKNIGIYEVQFQVSVTESGQLVIALDNGSGFLELPYSVVGRATGASQIVGISLFETTVSNTKLSIFNPSGNTPALTVTPFAGGTHNVSCHLVIKQLA
jgi:hypothetical protein